MENLISLDMVEKNTDQLRRLFTRLQLNIIKKRLKKIPLDNNEKTYYYKYIKPKIRAMLSFFDINELNIKGKQYMMESRIPRAIQILNKMKKKHKNKKIMISGSFLFNKNYKDLDVFVFTKYNKEDYKKSKVHVTFLPESSLNSLFFSSLSQISISNFSYNINLTLDIEIDEILNDYELLINYILNKDDYQKELRDFLLKTEYVSKKVILNPKQLYDLKNKLENRRISEILCNTLINTLVIRYKEDTLKHNLTKHIQNYKESLKEYPNAENLKIYTQTYKKVIELGT